MNLRFTGNGIRILDFDLEARPLSWLGGDFVTKEITAVAFKFIGSKGKPKVLALGEYETPEMVEALGSAILDADMVAGHYIRGYDLPLLNNALLEFGYPPLLPVLAHDTKLDLHKRQGISGSQESLSAMLGIRAPKVQMNQAKWRAANRLTKEGIAATKARVAGDVVQNIEMRSVLLRRGWLGPPRMWDGKPAASAGRYTG